MICLIKKQNFTIPKNLTEEIISELTKLAEKEDTQQVCLNFLERLPLDLQPKFMEHLITLNQATLIPFFQLVAKEGKPELALLANKAIKKMLFLGLTSNETYYVMNKRVFYKAWISKSRLLGHCNLLIAWKKTDDLYESHFMKLNFNSVGIKDLKIKNNISSFELACEQAILGNYMEIDFDDAISLLRDAFQINLKYESQGFIPAWFKEYEDLFEKFSDKDIPKINLNIAENLNIKEFVHVFINAIKNGDSFLLYDFSTPEFQKLLGKRNMTNHFFLKELAKKAFIKVEAEMTEKSKNYTLLEAQIIVSNEQDEIEKYLIIFEVYQEGLRYFINNYKIKDYLKLDYGCTENPLNYYTYCQLYEVKEPKVLQEWLEGHSEIAITGEFEEGTCYKWFKKPKEILDGIDITEAIFGEFIVTPFELVVFAKNIHDLGYICTKLEPNMLGKYINSITKFYSRVKNVYKVFTKPEARLAKLLEDDGIQKEKKAIVKLGDNYLVKDFCESNSYYKINAGADATYYYQKAEGYTEGLLCSEDVLEYQVRPNWFSISSFNPDALYQSLYQMDIKLEDTVFIDELESLKKGEMSPHLFNNLEKRAWHLLKFLHLANKENDLQKNLGIVWEPNELANRIGVLIS